VPWIRDVLIRDWTETLAQQQTTTPANNVWNINGLLRLFSTDDDDNDDDDDRNSSV